MIAFTCVVRQVSDYVFMYVFLSTNCNHMFPIRVLGQLTCYLCRSIDTSTFSLFLLLSVPRLLLHYDHVPEEAKSHKQWWIGLEAKCLLIGANMLLWTTAGSSPNSCGWISEHLRLIVPGYIEETQSRTSLSLYCLSPPILYEATTSWLTNCQSYLSDHWFWRECFIV